MSRVWVLGLEKFLVGRPLASLGTFIESGRINWVSDNRTRIIIVPLREKKKKKCLYPF